MARLGSGLVTGIVVLLVGASLAVDALADTHLPVIRVLLALLLVGAGARLVTRP